MWPEFLSWLLVDDRVELGNILLRGVYSNGRYSSWWAISALRTKTLGCSRLTTCTLTHYHKPVCKLSLARLSMTGVSFLTSYST